MSKAKNDFTKQSYVQETRALASVLEALADLSPAQQSFVMETAAQRLGIASPTAPKAVQHRTPRKIDKTHWYSDTQPFGPRNLDC